VEHLMVGVSGVEIIAPYTLRIKFDDGAERTVDFEPVLHGFYFAPLRDLSVFNQVRVDPEVQTLVWPNGADFDPATLYHWHDGEGAELAKRASGWGEKKNQVDAVTR
jgi:hypothetical protein